MSEQKMYTERELILAKRRAFVAGSTFEDEAWRKSLNVDYCSGADAIAESRKRFPLKVTRPRVVRDNDGTDAEFKVEGSTLYWRLGDSDWMLASAKWGISRKRVELWFDLFANPTEEVEVGE